MAPKVSLPMPPGKVSTLRGYHKSELQAPNFSKLHRQMKELELKGRGESTNMGVV